MRVANGALEDFHVKNCSKIVFFPLGAEILVAAVARNSIGALQPRVFRSRWNECVNVPRCKTFAAESRKSY